MWRQCCRLSVGVRERAVRCEPAAIVTRLVRVEWRSMKTLLTSVLALLAMASSAAADGLKCDMTQYKASTGLTATVDQDLLVLTWTGQAGSELRARFAIANGQPVVRDLAVRKQAGQ